MNGVAYKDDYQERKAERKRAYEATKGLKMVECTACSGSGHYDHNGAPACSACNGTGKVRERPPVGGMTR